MFQPAPPPIEPFIVACECGGKVTGVRSNTYQKPACPQCSLPVFVLPANAYPRPKSALKSPPSVPNATKLPPSVVIDEAPEVARRSKSGPPKGNSPDDQLPTTILRDANSKLITPLRLVAAAIAVAGTLTVAGVWHRTSVEYAKATVATATDRGKEALQEHDFPTAEKELDKARAALDLLKRDDDAANDVRQLSREATAMSRIVNSPLYEILQETLTARVPGSTEPLAMSSLNQGAWIIFDTKLISDAEHKGRYQVDAPLNVNDINVEIVLESHIFDSLSDRDEFGEIPRVIFAAQLGKMSQPDGDPVTSQLILEGKSAFLWTNYDNYVAIGFQSSDEDAEKQARALLESQAGVRQKHQ